MRNSGAVPQFLVPIISPAVRAGLEEHPARRR
nr:MAG TPA: hypothetical protein [Caudoviricetes sp.]